MQHQSVTLPAQALLISEAISTVSSSQSGPAVKRIHSDADVERWRASKAHADIVLFVARLCEAAVGKATRTSARIVKSDKDAIDRIWLLLDDLQTWSHDIEPLKTAQRFGNMAFRRWGERLEQRCAQIHEALLLDDQLKPFGTELGTYFLGGFGSWERLDYGSGHELSFLAWLSFLQRIQLFEHGADSNSETHTSMANISEERLALEILPKYLEVVWTLQDRYSLEPAGSHGVWGLDDYQFVPYAIGAAQLRTQSSYAPLAVTSSSHKPLPSPMSPLNLLQFVPSTSSLSTQASLRTNVAASTMAGPPFANLYTTSIARIHSLKRGPFNEHSPILYDIATTVPNWVKVHGGMMKMWQAECLGKRPVVQHFPFGVTGFVWDDAESDSTMRSQIVQEKAKTNLPMAPTAAPWAPSTRLPPFGRQAPTQAPWHRKPEKGQ